MSFRIQRAQAVIMEEVSLTIFNELKDPRVKNVTITGVKLTPDLRNGVVFFSVLGNEKEIAEATDGLTHAASFIRKQLSQKVQMKFTPQLRFEYDDTIKKAAHIMELLEKAKKHE
jgi:ribosome-binding factor A